MTELKKYYLYIIVLSFSILGTELTEFVLSFWILDKSGSVPMYSLFRTFEALPAILLAPFIGSLVDRFNRKHIFIIGQAVAAIGSLFLMFLFLNKSLNPWVIIMVTIAGSVSNLALYSAFYSLTKQIVKPEYLVRANSMAVMIYAVIEFIVPLLSPVLYKFVDLIYIFLFDVVTFTCAITFFVFQRFPLQLPHTDKKFDFIADLKMAIAFIKSIKGYRTFIFAGFVISLLFGIIEFLFVPLVIDLYSEQILGFLVAIASIGALVGGLIMQKIKKVNKPVSGSVGVVFCVGLAVFSFSFFVNIWALGVVVIIVYFLFSLEDIFGDALELTIVPQKIIGRVSGVEALISDLATPISFLLAGGLMSVLQAVNRVHAFTVFPPLSKIGSAEANAMIFILSVSGLLLIAVSFVLKKNKALKKLDHLYQNQLENEKNNRK